MGRLSGGKAEELTSYIERYFEAPPRWLRFVGGRENAFLAFRNQGGYRYVLNTAMAGLAAFDFAVAAAILSGMVPRAEIAYLIFVAFGVIDIPILVTMFLLEKFPPAPRHLESLVALNCAFIAVGIVAINRMLTGEIALCDAFSMVALPVTVNALPITSFRIGVFQAAGYLPLMIANAVTRTEYSNLANGMLIFTYVFSTAVTLGALYRAELAERKNYLNILKENIRNEEISRANRQLSELSRTDALTGLPNRRAFDERFAEAVGQARETGTTLTLVVLDIDHFKRYNDHLGHPAGDACIRQVARALAEVAGAAPNVIGRIGGEEFAAVLPGVGAEGAAAFCAAVRTRVRDTRLPHPALGERSFVSVSLGAACMNPRDPESTHALLDRADAALYRAKRAGRDRAEFDLKVVGA